MPSSLLRKPTPNGREISFGENEIIVSKTDLKGHITYTNTVFFEGFGLHRSRDAGPTPQYHSASGDATLHF